MNLTQLYTKFLSKKGLNTAVSRVAVIKQHTAWAAGLADADLVAQFKALAGVPLSTRTAKGFALIREAAGRSLGMPHFDVQLAGGFVLLEGHLAEMRTGEGKTLTVTLPAALLALEGKGVHVITANSYLALRDAALMRPVYAALGLTVAAVHSEQSLAEKKAAYACDITYGVGSEFGFDYLKDNTARDSDKKVQRGLFVAIVDEIDSVLVDEARVPLILANTAEDKAELVNLLDTAVRVLSPEQHFKVNAKERSADLTESGYLAVEAALVASGQLSTSQELYDHKHLPWVRLLHSAVRAYGLYRRDRDYVVYAGELVLVDTGTGRKMPGRRLEDGLHEALEARESLRVRSGTVTTATITYQSFFALYEKLSGLTGTALTDAEEFSDIYKLETICVPTNRPLIRVQNEDLVFLNKSDKFSAAVAEVATRHKKGQPVLVGCSTIRDAEVLSRLLHAAGVPHDTLTARHIEREAHIIAQAGRKGAVTVATNMAGRGTDILLGGEKPEQPANAPKDAAFEESLDQWAKERDEVIAVGGLMVLGTERSGMRRVDNQLAGRCGRQGNPGEVQFLLSLEDELLRVFGQNKKLGLLAKMIKASGSALGGSVVASFVESAQKNVEGQGFAARKSLMQFDSVLADQRNALYALRAGLLEQGCAQYVATCTEQAVAQWVEQNMPATSHPETWEAGALKKELIADFGLDLPLVGWALNEDLGAAAIGTRVTNAAKLAMGAAALSEAECKGIAFDVLDANWTEHLMALAELRENVSLKQHTGLNETLQFHKNAFELFQAFEAQLNMSIAELVLKPQGRAAHQAERLERTVLSDGRNKVSIALEKGWVSRNQLCPCGSGVRFKLCHGNLKPE